MRTFDDIREMKQDRGPRYLVHGTVRAGEHLTQYADTLEQAEEAAARMEADDLRAIRIVEPLRVTALEDLAIYRRRLLAARTAEREALSLVRAAAIRAGEAGLSESGTARALGVDRMTVRGWLGKR